SSSGSQSLPASASASHISSATASSATASSATASSGATAIPRAKQTWLWAGIAAVVLLSAVAGGLVFTRRTSALSAKDSILLTEFVNTTGDSVFDGTLKQALAVQLEQSPYLNIFPQSRIQDALKYMGKPSEER